MDDLNLPILKIEKQEDKVLSMDEYFEFVKFNFENFFNQESYKKWKQLLIVDVPFKL